jgi:hypothetical protein
MKKLLGIAMLSALSLPAFALQSTPRIDQRQANQAQRIEQGVRSGQLTRFEAERLRQGQFQIRRMERQALADGRLTPHERAQIEHAQDVEGRRIAQERHDRQNARW